MIVTMIVTMIVRMIVTMIVAMIVAMIVVMIVAKLRPNKKTITVGDIYLLLWYFFKLPQISQASPTAFIYSVM